MSALGKRIDAILTELQVKRESFARLCRVESSAARKWISGEKRPDDAELRRIADILDTDYDELFRLRAEDDEGRYTAELYSEAISRVRKLSVEELVAVLPLLEKKHKENVVKTADFGKQIKIRLVELDKPQTWLIAQVKERTGMFCDDSYLRRIMNGVSKPPKIVAAIREILDLPEE